MKTAKDKYKIFAEMERKREITTHFALLRASIIRGVAPTITASFDNGGNLTDIRSNYPLHIERALAEIDKMEDIALSENPALSPYYDRW